MGFLTPQPRILDRILELGLTPSPESRISRILRILRPELEPWSLGPPDLTTTLDARPSPKVESRIRTSSSDGILDLSGLALLPDMLLSCLLVSVTPSPHLPLSPTRIF